MRRGVALRQPELLLATGLMLLLAGCADDAASPGATSTGPPLVAPTAEFDDTTGALSGDVIDQEANPIVDARVLLTPSNLNTTTAQDGGFSFSRLAPGTYQVFASKLGYSSAAASVPVVVGEVADAVIQLSAIPTLEPRSETLGPYDGYFQCRWGTPTSAGPCGWVAFCNGNTCVNDTAATDVLWTQEENGFEFRLSGEDWEEIVFEARWVPTSLATNPQLRQLFSYTDRISTHWFARTNASESPLQWSYVRGVAPPDSQLPNGHPTEPNTNITLVAWMSVPSIINVNNPQPVGIALEQRYQVYVTVFYSQRAPPDYSAFPA